jgi:hypothetical protein
MIAERAPVANLATGKSVGLMNVTAVERADGLLGRNVTPRLAVGDLMLVVPHPRVAQPGLRDAINTGSVA